MRAGEWLLDLVYPPKCPFCRRVLERPREPLCPDCRHRLPWLAGEAARRRVDFADGCFSPLAYLGAAAEAVRRYKFEKVPAYGRPFGLLAAQCLRDSLEEGADGLTWPPLSRERLRERGFDQAELLARSAGEALGLPVFPTLQKTRHTPAQSGLEGESARRANALGAYALLPGSDVAGKRLVLVDDVVTSGATLGECAGVLKRAGALRVWCLTLAQARPGGG